MKILVTGASGFIGSHFVKMLCEKTDHQVVGFVRNTAQRNTMRLTFNMDLNPSRFQMVYGDLLGDISGLTEGCDAVVNFAAKTFVDHAIRDPWPFIEANVVGTYRLIEDARRNKVKRFIQVSTDEVYGAILSGAYKEDARINPTNPYAAAKAGADAIVVSYTHTFGLWTAVTRTENNYGPFQHPQKVFPAFVKALLDGKKLPVYGDGKHRRQWLWVDDHCDAIERLLHADVEPAQIFHVAGSQELENLELAKRIIEAFRKKHYTHWDNPDQWKDSIQMIDDHNVRPGHDRRYALVCDKMKGLGWAPTVTLEDGIQRAVDWYVDNRWWLT